MHHFIPLKQGRAASLKKIPVAIDIVVRVETLLDVTSAVYGSDAIANVANITECQESGDCECGCGGGEESANTRHLIRLSKMG